MKSITLKKREIPLIYTVFEMKQIQDEIGPLGKAIDIILGRNPDDKKDMSNYCSAGHLAAVAKLVRILGNAGLEEAGEAPDLTDKTVMRAIKPAQIIDVINACMDAMNEGMASEIPDKANDEPVDVMLEEIERKKEQAG